jgi:5-methylcytosine-specific restriction endonuclease McrA
MQDSAARVLSRPVLLLNKRWDPISTTTVREAIGLVAKGSAFVVDPETFERHDLGSWGAVSKAARALGQDVIRSQHLAIVPPEVVVLSAYDGRGERSVVFSRRNIFKRDRYTCQYCGVQPGPENLTIDHIVPRSRGGISSWENCVLACLECNKRKADRTPEQAGMKLRKIPKKPSWRALAQVHPAVRRESWEQFLGRAYWEIELEP